MKNKIAFITGIAGQDGAYLASFLRSQNYEVRGLVRWDSYVDPLSGFQRLDELDLVNDDIRLHTGDLTDAQNITALLKEIQPDEIYNLGAMSHVKPSFDTPAATLDINAKGTLHVLEAVRLLDMGEKVRIYQASSSEMYGNAQPPQHEETPFEPCSPYGVSKLAAFWMARTYRNSYDFHVSNGILFNHESPLRGQDFVTAKIARAAAEFEQGRTQAVELGNLDSIRDWGHAKDYLRGMWMMLQQDKPDDYVLATGKGHTVREFATHAFAHAGIPLDWRGHGIDEVAINKKNKKIVIRINSDLFRPNEVHHLLGDPSKAMRVLGWRPEISFEQLIADLVNAQRNTIWKRTQSEAGAWARMAG
jgi:GDPmannose 4,6-dehydratase